MRTNKNKVPNIRNQIKNHKESNVVLGCNNSSFLISNYYYLILAYQKREKEGKNQLDKIETAEAKAL